MRAKNEVRRGTWRTRLLVAATLIAASGCATTPEGAAGAVSRAPESANAREQAVYGDWYDATTVVLPAPPVAGVARR